MADDRGSWLSTATTLFFGWALLSVCVRLWVTFGRKQSWNSSGTAVVGATLIAILHVGANFWAIKNRYGRPLDEITDSHRENMEKALYMSQISYLGAVGLTRVSTAFFMSQLTRHAPQVRMSYIIAAASGIWAAVSILVVALRPDLSTPWSTLDGTSSMYHRWLATEVTGLLIEAALWMLSMSLIWGLQMKLGKRMTILAVFGCRMLLVPIVAIRLHYLSPEANTDPTLTSITPHILTEAILNFALVCTSITSLKPFLKPFHTGAIVNTVGGTGSGLYSGSQTQPPSQGIYMLASAVPRDRKKLEETTLSTMDSARTGGSVGGGGGTKPGKLYVGNKQQNLAVVSASPGPQRRRPSRDDGGSVDSQGSEQMIIRTTKGWAVSYEGREESI